VPEVVVANHRSMDDRFMQRALALAASAAAAGEVPVGAVVVQDDAIIGEGWNQSIASSDPTAHAEVVALRAAGRGVGNYRLAGATVYVTLEPCLMCVGALVHARVDTLVFGIPEPKAGAVESTMRATEHPALNHRVRVVSGVLASDCRAILQQFFRERRG
jgi:tRNA(adenine34) deaminase